MTTAKSNENNTLLEALLDYGVDIKNRVVYWGTEYIFDGADESHVFNSPTVERVVRGMNILASINKQPITLKMNSVGGSLGDAFYLVDEILACPCQVKFVGGGEICSAATIIMAVCDERWVHKNAEIMIHELSAHNAGKFSEMDVTHKVLSDIMQQIAKLYAANSIMSKKFYEDLLGSGRDVFISAKECVALGLADGIIEPLKRGNLRKKRAKHLGKTPSVRQLNSMVKNICERSNIKHAITDIPSKIEKPEEEPSDPNIIIEEVQPEVKDEPTV